MGPAPISHAELYFYARLHGFEWSPWELGAVRALDRAFLFHHAETTAKSREGG